MDDVLNNKDHLKVQIVFKEKRIEKGINHWAFPAGMPVEEVIGLAAQYGFRG